VGLKAVNKSGEKYNPGLAKRRALFPEGRGLGVGGKESKKKAKTKGGGNQTANFPKPNIILILADDVGGILIVPHSMCFID
jgi:hypothetical protein